MKKSGILIEFYSLLKHDKVPKKQQKNKTNKTKKKTNKHTFCKNKSTNIGKQGAHMPFFTDQKVKAHTQTFILFVKLCKKPI